MDSFYSIENSVKKADSLFRGQDILRAKHIYADIVDRVPDHSYSRDAIKRCSRNLHVRDKRSLISNWLAKIRVEQSFPQNAIPGWVYSLLVERQFAMEAPVNLTAKPQQTFSDTAGVADVDRVLSPYHLLLELLSMPDAYSLFSRMRSLAGEKSEAILCDSYFTHRQPISSGTSSDSERVIKVAIVGAGCVGLTLANGLKHSFGNKVHVLLVENRIQAPHIKKPYARSWLTFVPLSTLEGFIDPVVVSLFKRVGSNGLIGVPINIYETLLLLSCKCLGVDCLFDDVSNYSLFQNAEFDVVFDATGGRLDTSKESRTVDMHAGPTFRHDNLSQYTDGFAKFGISRIEHPCSIEITTAWHGNYLRPLYNGIPLCIPNLKLTSVPARQYEELIGWAKNNNHDSKFYFWPGGLDGQINELLILVCLSKEELILFRELIRTPIGVSALSEQLKAQPGYDSRFVKLLEILNTSENCRAEPPFLYSPYLKPYSLSFDLCFGTPVVPIGDSVYNGNPKVGNGLTRHLLNVRYIHDTLHKLWGT